MKKLTADTAVIGGGAAGMLSAAMTAEKGQNVILLEKNSYTGKKLRITGKGRCNLTNSCSIQEMMENVPTNGRFLYSCLNRFSQQDTMALFERLGVPLKVERGNRVFPVSDKASDIVDALRRYLSESGVKVIYDSAKSILTDGGEVSGVLAGGHEIGCGSVILATGGLSYPLTGSTGDGYEMAGKLGHKIVPLKASLVPLESEDPDCREMQGLSLRNVTLNVLDKSGKSIYSDFGEMLFTHFGISGPLALSASAHMRDFDCDKYTVVIDLKPALDRKKLDLRILRDFEKYSNKDFANSLSDLVHKKMIPVIVRRSCIPPELKVNSITREQRSELLELLKEFRIPISGPRPISEAIITSGGIDVGEINPSTMESKLVGGLFFAGEIIDVDAYTGGFNLQIAWSTAAAASYGAAGY